LLTLNVLIPASVAAGVAIFYDAVWNQQLPRTEIPEWKVLLFDITNNSTGILQVVSGVYLIKSIVEIKRFFVGVNS
jgi:hypothetical protein